MTREEAIAILTETQVVYFAPNGKEKVQEALDMAIKSLQSNMSQERVNHESTNDLISRADLMKEFAERVKESNNSDYIEPPNWNDAVSLVGSMPSVSADRTTDDDLISRADAIEAVASITMSIHLSDVICDKLLALPSADAVQVVRCKDCKHGQYDATHYFCAEYGHKVYEDDFCSYGERREL